MKPRTYFILLVSVLVISQTALSQQQPEVKFRQGSDYFSAGNYEKALEVWTDLYKTGYRSAELDYNIGSAHFKINNIPGAILFYERASLLKPADEDINYNLQISRTLVVDRFEEIPELFFVRWYNFIALLLSSNIWARLSIASFILCLLFLSVFFYTSKYRIKVLGFWFALVLLIVSIASLAFTLRNKSLVYDSGKAIILSPIVNGKSSPDSSGTDLFLLHEGTKVTVEDEVGEWYEVRLSDGNKGWIPSNSLEII
ncbi:MAG: SH3 domain-containing protein [Bacteroidia bacterium]|nr:SH3 domain-containing protein [Bacteroidia bacterium]